MAATMRRDKGILRGSETFSLLQLSRVVAVSMPSEDYDVYYRADGLLVNASTSAQTANSFTINLSVGLAGVLYWIAVER